MDRRRLGQPASSSSVNKHKAFLTLWDTNAPGKVKVHFWRLLQNGLAVGAELHRRRIKGGVFCPACGREETIQHRFWSCPHSRLFWTLLQSDSGCAMASPPVCVESHRDLHRWLLDWLTGAKDEERELVMHGVYGLWLARNEARDGKQIAPAHEIMTGVLHHVQEWRGIHQQRHRIPADRPRQRWEVPDVGWIKINSDGTVTKAGGCGGGGAVLRDHSATFIVGSCYHFPNISDPEATEILTCRKAFWRQDSLEINSGDSVGGFE